MNSMPILHELSDTAIISTSGSTNPSGLQFIQSLPNMTTKLLNQFIWWRKSRNKDVLKSCNSFNNVCVIMRSEQSTRILNPNQQNSVNSITECFSSQTSVTPAVSFINRGEGLVSMQLMDRIMINDNELYSMDLSDHQINSDQHLSGRTSIRRQPESRSLERTSDSLYGYDIEGKQWFGGSIERENAIQLIENSPIGSFVIRYSSTKSNCFALTLRVPNEYHMSGIANYLVVMTDRNTFKIKGFCKEFASLESLVIHHSIMKELLPCPLLLPKTNFNNNTIYTNYSNLSLNMKSKNQINENEDILVDVDSDPNYQKILINFRQTMSKSTK